MTKPNPDLTPDTLILIAEAVADAGLPYLAERLGAHALAWQMDMKDVDRFRGLYISLACDAQKVMQ